MPTVNSLWLIIGALAAFAIAYRLYGAFLATRVAMLDDRRITPANRLSDGVDYHPTRRLVLFGVHFAAIAGPGPLVGPVLAAQWGYLPGFVWILVGACLAGGVHDFVVLLASVRQDGLSLPQIARKNIGTLSGITTSVATMFIVIAILASVGVVIVNALAESSWGMFTIIVTIPAALLTGFWMYRIRPGKVGEASVVGVTLVMAGVIAGRLFAQSRYGHLLVFDKKTLSLILPAYAFIASVLPVWLLMCPRDYLSSYLKIGVIIVLAAGILAVHPYLQMPATTPFIDGTGPVVTGKVWPFVCIVIMCGALSGFHALVASGTTPKMVQRETDIRAIGYGAMLVEGVVSVTALIAACTLAPGDYFAINITQDTAAQQAKYTQVVATQQTTHNWDLKPFELPTLEKETEEKLVGRTGGAVTLAVGMAKVITKIPGLGHLMSYWYHFVIMFEALFILTLLETGTRVARFIVEETVAISKAKTDASGGNSNKSSPAAALVKLLLSAGASCLIMIMARDYGQSHFGAAFGPLRFYGFMAALTALLFVTPKRLATSALACSAWGYLLYRGDLNTLWRMLGISNQLLAVIALAVGTTYLLNTARRRVYALCTGLPLAAVLVTVVTASVMSIGDWWTQSHTAPGPQSFQLKLMCVLASIMLLLTVAIMADATRRWVKILSHPAPPAPPAGLPREAMLETAAGE